MQVRSTFSGTSTIWSDFNLPLYLNDIQPQALLTDTHLNQVELGDGVRSS